MVAWDLWSITTNLGAKQRTKMIVVNSKSQTCGIGNSIYNFLLVSCCYGNKSEMGNIMV